MKKSIKQLLFLTLLVISSLATLSACGTKKDTSHATSGQLTVVATNSILANLVEEVGKEHVSVHSLVPRGTDPHEYEPLPDDIAKASDADVIFYNGLNLETGGNGWFNKLMTMAKKKEDKDYFVVSREVDPQYLTSDGQETQVDPHAWLSLANGILYVTAIKEVLVEKDPEHREDYEKNAQVYSEKLQALHDQSQQLFADIPSDKKLLVTSEGAFKYFAKDYQIPTAYIWEINTEDQGTPDQMRLIIDTLRQTAVPVLFVEQSVDPRSMETVARETKLPIYETVLTDSLAKSGQPGDTYYSMMAWNLEKIHAGLKR
ncbi:metal ABC transporter substrate-binding protein [Vagococcus penaei]|uniref:Metal ABC transporter substrate-binding protein n=1 Tax=Vagococcus penaei TaxID=633807 RepID=A0A1Q2D5F3_9ENTE|nr:metal ABC transporter substrate-binding protein [Vagococcus penaei]AQP53447.1 metal ABC transporter substrate-binding protein [Vagococcus penaei]RSU00837.1 metal ABC transporter substrate-binding protein [Vagococcus penaei]